MTVFNFTHNGVAGVVIAGNRAAALRIVRETYGPGTIAI